MYNKIFIYGDSFSHYPKCQTAELDMWYHHAFSKYNTAQFITRTKVGMTTETMFLQAGHDCTTQSDPCIMVIALGPLHRITVYTDGWYEKEKLQKFYYTTSKENFPNPPRSTDLTDCLPYFECLPKSSVNRENINLFHPTLLWAKLFDNIIKLNAYAQSAGHKLIVLHMSHTAKEYHPDHPLIAPLEQAALQCNYITEQHSCTAVCQQAGIKPWDFDQYGYLGHHSTMGQKYFGNYIKKMID